MTVRHTAQFISLLLALAPPLALPLAAQTVVDERNVTAGDVATKPLQDMNITRDPVPPILVAAREDPYTLAGLRKCSALQAEVRRLDAVLGDDIDVAQEKTRGEKRGNTVGNIAKSIVGSLIPFGGVIREVSGANNNERQWQFALYAGAARRAYLKGVGQQKGCTYPARPAGPRDVAALAAARAAAEQAKKDIRTSDSDARR